MSRCRSFCLFISNYGQDSPNSVINWINEIVMNKEGKKVVYVEKVLFADGFTVIVDDALIYEIILSIHGEKFGENLIWIIAFPGKMRVLSLAFSHIFKKYYTDGSLNLIRLAEKFIEIGANPENIDFYSLSFTMYLFYCIGVFNKKSRVNRISLEWNCINCFPEVKILIPFVPELKTLHLNNNPISNNRIVNNTEVSVLIDQNTQLCDFVESCFYIEDQNDSYDISYKTILNSNSMNDTQAISDNNSFKFNRSNSRNGYPKDSDRRNNPNSTNRNSSNEWASDNKSHNTNSHSGWGSGNAQSSGGWGSGNTQSSGGWESGNAQSSGGWGSENTQSSGGWGSGNTQSSGGWGSGNAQSSGGWGSGNTQSSGGWGSGNTQSSGGWGSNGNGNSSDVGAKMNNNDNNSTNNNSGVYSNDYHQIPASQLLPPGVMPVTATAVDISSVPQENLLFSHDFPVAQPTFDPNAIPKDDPMAFVPEVEIVFEN